MKTGRTKGQGSGDDHYFDLVREYPLRSIRTAAEASAAGEFLNKLLMAKADDARDAGEWQYINAMSDLIIRYQERAPNRLPKLSPVELLRHLVEESGMTINDLGKVIGSQSAASMVLSGQRELSKSHVRKLAARFKLNPGVFL